ncbi:MAG: rod shape-determining protein RodA [Prevotella sp.]|nr:rod shape-determining protein RodA [Prevotella sp.]
MDQPADNRGRNIWRSLDWLTVALYVILLVCGWFSVCGASYTYGETDFFSLSTRSGMQVIWIASSILLAFVLLMTDSGKYETFSLVIYAFFLLLLIATIFNPHEIKGSRSWLVMGPLRLQPAEFAKFATALMLAKVMSIHNFSMSNMRHAAAAIAVIVLPMLAIIGQKETGSALVYLAFFLVLYREGMSGTILFTGVAMVVYFVVGIKYDDINLYVTPTSVGKYAVLILIQLFACGLLYIACKERKEAKRIAAAVLVATLLVTLFALYIVPFDLTKALLVLSALTAIYLIYLWLRTRITGYLLVMFFALGSIAFLYSADYTMDNILESHQRVRINVLLGLEEDLRGAGYNVHQSEIAIGSGGLQGKGFLNGTQTKLKYVPEQDTDFIFCTVGEEEGFLGSVGVLVVFLLLILRLIHLSERQPFAFGRVYGYCVVSIFLFHVFINVGMVLGLMPVIGIPLPFFSYGGSSLWGFTILLFIFLRIDANRHRRLFS